MKTKKRNKLHRLFAFVFAMAIVIGSVNVPAMKVSAESKTTSNGITVTANDVTVEYDGKPHYPDITIDAPSGVTYRITYKASSIGLSTDVLPSFTDVGTYVISGSLFTDGAIGWAIPKSTLTITAPSSSSGDSGSGDSGSGDSGSGDSGSGDSGSGDSGSGDSGSGDSGSGDSGSGDSGSGDSGSGDSGSGDSGSGDSDNYTVEEGVAYVKNQYDYKAFNSFDSLGSDNKYHIDCAKYKIPVNSDECTEIIDYIQNNCYSDNFDFNIYDNDSDNEMNDKYYFLVPNHWFIKGIGGETDDTETYITSFDIEFIDNVGSQNTVSSKYKKINAAEDDILSQYLNSTDDSQTIENYILSVHDGMCRVLDFAYDDWEKDKGANPDLHTADGVLANRKGLCDGYAYVFKYFMDLAKIPCRVMYSQSLNHMWNQVYLYGNWVHVDVAWDDMVTTSASFTNTFSNAAIMKTMYGDYNKDYIDIGYAGHNYFLKNDTEMRALGYSDWNYYYPTDPNNKYTHPALGTNTQNKCTLFAKDYDGTFSLIGDSWYAADGSGTSKTINKWNAATFAKSTVTLPVNVRNLTTDGQYLIYTDGKNSVYRSTVDGSKTWVWQPSIYGTGLNLSELAYRNGSLQVVYSSSSTHNSIQTGNSLSGINWTEYTPSSDDEQNNNPDSGSSGSGSGSGSSGSSSGSGSGSGSGSSGSSDSNSGSGSSSGSDSGSGSGSSAGNTGSSGSDNGSGGSSSGNTNQNIAPNNQSSNNSAQDTGHNDTESYEDTLDEGDDVTINGVTYEITENDDSREVAYAGSDNKKATSCVIPDTVTIGNTSYAVTEIADNAFSGNKKLKSVKVGKNVAVIGDSAFAKCTSLKSVTFSSNVTEIGNNAFKKTSLKKIVLPSNVKKIGKNAFYQCKKLKTIQFKSTTVPTISKNAFKRIDSKASFKVPAKSLKQYKKVLNSKAGLTKKMKVKK